MKVEVLKKIIDESLKFNEKLCVYYGDSWKEHDSIVEEVKKKKINMDGIVAVVKQSMVRFKIYFYEDSMLINTEKTPVAYSNILHGGRCWDFKRNRYDYSYCAVMLKGDQLGFSISKDFDAFLVTFCRKIIEERFDNDNEKISEYYLEVKKEQYCNIGSEFGKTCIDYALRYCKDNETALELFAGYDWLTAVCYLNHKNRKVERKLYYSAEKKVESKKRYLSKAKTLFENAENYGYLEAYMHHMNYLSKLLRSGMPMGKLGTQMKNIAHKYLNAVEQDEVSLKVYKVLTALQWQPDSVVSYYIFYGQIFYTYEAIRDFELSSAFIELALKSESAKDHEDYSKVTYILAGFYRDGLGGKEKSIDMQISYLIEGANRGYGLAEYELFKLYYKRGDLKEAEIWRKKAKSHGIKDEKEYKKSLSERFDEKIGIEGFGKIMNAIGNAVAPIVEVAEGANKIGGYIGDMVVANEELKTKVIEEGADREKIKMEMEEVKAKHIQKMAGQNAVNKRLEEQKYSKKKK